MAWHDLRNEIADMFQRCEGFLEADDPDAWSGMGPHENNLSLVRETTREELTPEQRQANRKALEKKRAPQRAELERKRRAYKTAKQREYDAKKRAA